MVKRIRLQERDRAILDHIQRYRLTTHFVLQQRFFPAKGDDAVTSTLRRLRAADYVESADLAPPNRKYYHLTRRACGLLGLAASYGRPLGEQALPTRYATLRFCCGTKNYRHLMEPSEFAAEFPDCIDPHIPKHPYYLDDEGDAPRLAFLIPDLGAEAGRIIRKCRKAFGERLKVSGFRELIEDDAFHVTVLTAQPSKKLAIEAAQKRAESFKHPVRVEVVPLLASLL